MPKHLICFRVDEEDDDYIRSISKDVCRINDVYESIYSNFCDNVRSGKRKKKKGGKGNAKTNPTTAKRGNRKKEKSGKGSSLGRERPTPRKPDKNDPK